MKLSFVCAAIVAMSATMARAETATSRALDACGKLDGAKYHACLDRIPNCEAVLVRDVDDNSGFHWHKGMEFDINGGSNDPGQLCQHGGTCIPVSSVRFKTACMIVIQKTHGAPPYYHWERGDGSLVKAVDQPLVTMAAALEYCTRNPDARETGRDDESMLSVRTCARRILRATPARR
jgi:hypothetical protein